MVMQSVLQFVTSYLSSFTFQDCYAHPHLYTQHTMYVKMHSLPPFGKISTTMVGSHLLIVHGPNIKRMWEWVMVVKHSSTLLPIKAQFHAVTWQLHAASLWPPCVATTRCLVSLEMWQSLSWRRLTAAWLCSIIRTRTKTEWKSAPDYSTRSSRLTKYSVIHKNERGSSPSWMPSWRSYSMLCWCVFAGMTSIVKRSSEELGQTTRTIASTLCHSSQPHASWATAMIPW